MTKPRNRREIKVKIKIENILDLIRGKEMYADVEDLRIVLEPWETFDLIDAEDRRLLEEYKEKRYQEYMKTKEVQNG